MLFLTNSFHWYLKDVLPHLCEDYNLTSPINYLFTDNIVLSNRSMFYLFTGNIVLSNRSMFYQFYCLLAMECYLLYSSMNCL